MRITTSAYDPVGIDGALDRFTLADWMKASAPTPEETW
jgi:hypothetical protein